MKIRSGFVSNSSSSSYIIGVTIQNEEGYFLRKPVREFIKERMNSSDQEGPMAEVVFEDIEAAFNRKTLTKKEILASIKKDGEANKDCLSRSKKEVHPDNWWNDYLKRLIKDNEFIFNLITEKNFDCFTEIEIGDNHGTENSRFHYSVGQEGLLYNENDCIIWAINNH